MKSTGEVMGVAKTFAEAFIKSQMGASVILPKGGKAFLSVRKEDHLNVIDIAQSLIDLGFKIVATKGTANVIRKKGINVDTVNKDRRAIADSYEIRRNALQNKVTYYTTLSGARAACVGMNYVDEIHVESLQSLHKLTT